ncbi:MAG: LysE family translocator [Pseudomonadota bacterium]
MTELLPSAPVLASYALAVAALAITPGPDMTLFLSKAIGHSRAGGIACNIGASLGLLVHSAMVALGLSALLVASATAFTVLKYVGAAYLAWLAYDALRNGSSFTLNGRSGDREPLSRLVAKGLFINLLNPKIIVFFITFLPQFVSATDPDATAKLFVLGVLFVAISFPITMALILSAGSFATLLKRSRWVARAIDFLFAGVLGAFAVKLFLWQGGR